ncbi:MAG TPA: protein kinase [Polyangiaceae bacterium]|nr:protein kinase [Polyangiaceae bacterium]
MSSELPEELPPDSEFGAYVIRVCIGRGGMARIYRAEQAALGRPVALKVLDRWVLDQPTGKDRFLREARAAASIKHPNVVDILDVGVWRDRPFIVMELLMGCDLDTYLDRFGTLSEREIASLALPIIAGVMAVHDAGVVHRDLKPSNIFLSNGPDGVVVPKVLDFGVSKFSNTLNDPLQRATKTREIIGTPAYMAPEALDGVRELGPAGDQYALGAVLYECAVGRPPFEGETLLELLKAVAMGKVEPPSALRPEISPPLEQVILRAIERDPTARFASLREMGRALWPLADGRTQTIWQPSFGNGRVSGLFGDTAAPTLMVQKGDMERTPATTPSVAQRRFRSRGWMWPVGIGAGLAALGALAIGLSSHAPEPSGSPLPASSVALAKAETPGRPAAGASDTAPPSSAAAAPAGQDVARPGATPGAGAEDAELGQRSSALQPQNKLGPRRAKRRSAAPIATPEARPPEPRAAPRRPEASAESELEGLFREPREAGRALAHGNDAEGEGRGAARGANDSPIPE